jgi:hypothetical protein
MFSAALSAVQGRSGMFVPDPGSGFFSNPDPRVKKTPDPGVKKNTGSRIRKTEGTQRRLLLNIKNQNRQYRKKKLFRSEKNILAY